MKVLEKISSGPMHKWLEILLTIRITNPGTNADADPDPDRDTGKTSFGEGMHCPTPTASNFHWK